MSEEKSGTQPLTREEAEAMLQRLSLHFGCPVMPIERYCAALRLWQTAYREKAIGLKAKLDAGETKISFETKLRDRVSTWDRDVEQEFKVACDTSKQIDFVFMQIAKSNLLARLLYEGESLRTEPCPVHKGFWSGCAWNENPEDDCACQRVQGSDATGSNVTGWLPGEPHTR